jgi:putative ABC transport system substrate-binding protein
MLLPGARRVAILQNPNSLNADAVLADARLAASPMGLQIEVLSADADRAIDMAFEQMAKLRADAFLVGTNTLFADRRDQLVALAARYALPAIYFSREHVKAGGLMSYATDVLDRERQVGVYAGRILKGEKPADLPVMRAAKFDLVINLQTARALHLDVPPSLLAIADEVIE